MMRWALSFLLLSAAGASYTPSNLPRNSSTPTREFLLLEGKTADPCNKWTSPAAVAKSQWGRTDCNSVPDSQVTVLLPSETSDHPNKAALVAGTHVLTLNGRGFESLGSAGVAFPFTATIALALQNRGCLNADTTAGWTATATIVSSTTITFMVPTMWTKTAMELEDDPRLVCIKDAVNAGYFYTGFKIGTVYHCDLINANRACPPPPSSTTILDFEGITFDNWRQRRARKTCCPGTLGTLKTGQCILGPADNVDAPTACCGAARIEVSQERCCHATKELTSWYSTPCPCWRQDTTCPINETCCLPQKYNELNGVQEAVGECYLPATHMCCNTGMRFDPGSQQCCVINGVQSANVPCPCNSDSHCYGGHVNDSSLSTLKCCAQTNDTRAFEFDQCNIYSNYPNGTSPYQSQRCLGSCFDPQYQICCNGVQCIKEYEKCCNSTCCNRFTQTCEVALRPGTPNNRWNWDGFNVKYEACSTIEQMSPLKALLIFVVPAVWLLITFIGTGMVLVFANKASSRSYASIERAMINVALVTILMTLALYFSPAYKYGLTVLFVQLFTILTAAARIKRLNVVCLALQVLLVLYIIDPFHGSQFLTLSSSRNTAGLADRDSAGLIHVLGKMYRSSWSVDSDKFCNSYYLDYFRRDPNLRDTDRFDNPADKNFGYCHRGFVLALLVFAAILIICVLLQLFLTLIALLLRFTKPQVKLVVREDYEEDYDY